MRRDRRQLRLRFAVAGLLLPGLALGGCGQAGADDEEGLEAPPSAAAQEDVECDADDGGLTLPDGFCALVVSDELDQPRHLAVADDGDLYVAQREAGFLALRDTTGDGRVDVRERFDDRGGTGVALHGGYVYIGPDDGVARYRLGDEGRLRPTGEAEEIVRGLRAGGGHAAKPIAIDADGDLFVNVGSPSNSCQEEDRAEESPGQDPCPELEENAGIWRFDADRTGQTQEDGERYATGMRNTVALAMGPDGETPYGAIHGRDQFLQNWPGLYSAEESAEKPSEEFVRIEEGDDYGWPYCYHDPQRDEKVLAPEYGGDKESVGRCAEKDDPLLAFPGHWGPNALLVYDGEQFPERFRGGAFIAFHGSWNRAPRPQEGYNVVFLPFETGEPSGDWEVFAENFAGEEKSPRDAEHRPTGLAQGPDGSLYVSDDAGGTIWRILHRGE